MGNRTISKNLMIQPVRHDFRNRWKKRNAKWLIYLYYCQEILRIRWLEETQENLQLEKFHERTHTREKAFKCTKCDNTSFVQ